MEYENVSYPRWMKKRNVMSSMIELDYSFISPSCRPLRATRGLTPTPPQSPPVQRLLLGRHPALRMCVTPKI